MWKDLTMSERNSVIELAVSQGVFNLNTIKTLYDQQNQEFGDTNNQILDNKVKPIIAAEGGELNIGDPRQRKARQFANRPKYQNLKHYDLKSQRMSEEEEEIYAQQRDKQIDMYMENTGADYETAEQAIPYDPYKHPSLLDQIKARVTKQVGWFGQNFHKNNEM